MKPKTKILFVLPSMMAGGAERVMTFVANNLNSDIFDVKLLVIGFERDSVYDFNSENIVFLNKTRVANAVFDIFRLLKTQKPDIVISSISHLNVLMGFFSFFFSKIKFVGREASVISLMKNYSGFKFKINYYLIKFFYKFLDNIICQSLDMVVDFEENIKINKKKLVLIHNPITIKQFAKNDSEFSNKVKYITVGRLSEEKGHLRVLKALAKTKTKNKNFKYTIVGSGPLEEILKKEVVRLNLEENVLFIRHTKQVYEELVKHDIFLQGSFVEGFPNGLLEAMSVGLPAIAFEAPGGTREIILENVNGFIVKDVEELVAVLNCHDLVAKFDKSKIIMSVKSRFASEIIIEKYENLFISLI